MKDSKIWNKMLKGDKTSLEMIYRTHINVLYDYGRKFSADRGLVEDCIQNLFIDLWNKRENLGQTSSIKAYLMLSLKRRIFRESSNVKKMDFKESDDHVFFDMCLSREEIIIMEENKRKHHAQLEDALDKLTKKQKELLYLKYQQGLSSKSIAKILGINYQSVRNALHRIIRKLQDNMLFLFFF